MSALTLPTTSAVIITRNRPEMLRRTIESVLGSRRPVVEIVVTDDSSDDRTRRMLAAEFPSVVWTEGPRRGISANRNHGTEVATGDYLLLLDDDILVDPDYVEVAMRAASECPGALFFPAMSEVNERALPSRLDFLGFATLSYAPGAPYVTANCQALILPRALALAEPWDEYIATYGYEEMDFSYRVAAAGYPIVALTQCNCIHLAPGADGAFRPTQDASRLYVTYKRYAYIDRRPGKAWLFAGVGVVHHFLAAFKRAGWTGLGQAWTNVKLATVMIRRYRASLEGAKPTPAAG